MANISYIRTLQYYHYIVKYIYWLWQISYMWTKSASAVCTVLCIAVHAASYGNFNFYRMMLCRERYCHGKSSVCLSACLSVTLRYCGHIQGGPIKTAHFLRYHIFAATTDIITRFSLKCSEITAENNKQHFFKLLLNILCKLVKIWYLLWMSVLTDSNNINFEVCRRVLSQSVYALLSLIQAMLNMSTLSMNDQGKSFWELVYGSVNQVLADHRPAVLYDIVHFRLLWKEYLTLVLKKLLVVFCCNFWTLQQKPHDSICSGCKKYGISKMCGFYWATL